MRNNYLYILFFPLLVSTPAKGQTTESTDFLSAIHREAKADAKQNPESLERIYSIQGIQPEHYLKRRLPQPEVARELRRIPDVAAILMSLHLNGFSDFPLIRDGNFDAKIRAIRMGVLAAIGPSKHRLADRFLIYVAKTEPLDAGTADVLFRSLGQTQTSTALSYLGQSANNEILPVALRSAAIFGLGHHRSIEASLILRKLMRHSMPQIQLAAISASTTLGSSWAWKAKGQDQLGSEIRTKLSQEIISTISRGNEKNLIQLGTRATETLAVIGTHETLKELEMLSAKATPGGRIASFATVAARRVSRGLSRRH